MRRAINVQHKKRPIIHQPKAPAVTIPDQPSYVADDSRYKIALIQPGSWGDNINSTLMFKPLRAKYPNCVIDVYTASIYSSAFYNNPHINNLLVLPVVTKDQALHLLHVFPPLVEGHGYDKIFRPHPMLNGDKWTSIRHGEFGTNLINAWIRALEEADVPYDVPLETSLRLTDTEVKNARSFFERAGPAKRSILMECEGLSGQTFWDGKWTMALAGHLLDGQTNLFISRRGIGPDVMELMRVAPGRVHFAGDLTIRECAELFNRCDAFFSVSSGLSNACNSDWCKKDGVWIETVNSEAVTSAPIRKEGKTFWFDQNIESFLSMVKGRGL